MAQQKTNTLTYEAKEEQAGPGDGAPYALGKEGVVVLEEVGVLRRVRQGGEDARGDEEDHQDDLEKGQDGNNLLAQLRRESDRGEA